MHTILVLVGGHVLLGAFVLVARVVGAGTPAAMATAALYFLPIWLVAAAVNMWIGVSRAGYTVAQELPIFLVVFAVPAVVAAFVWWKLSRA